MKDAKVVEARFTASMHDLTDEQVFDLIRVSPGHEISVGLGYGGTAAAVALDVPASIAADLGRQLSEKASELGLDVAFLEVLDPEEYEARALGEDVGAEGGDD